MQFWFFTSVHRLLQSGTFCFCFAVNLEGDLFFNDFKQLFGKILSNSNSFVYRIKTLDLRLSAQRSGRT